MLEQEAATTKNLIDNPESFESYQGRGGKLTQEVYNLAIYFGMTGGHVLDTITDIYRLRY